jgi:hypothetical protein
MVKPGGTGKAGVGHLGEPGAFAAQLVLHLAVTFGVAVAEKVNVLHGFRVGSRIFQFSSRSAHGEVLYMLRFMNYVLNLVHHGDTEGTESSGCSILRDLGASVVKNSFCIRARL